MYLALNNLQGLICHKIQTNKLTEISKRRAKVISRHKALTYNKQGPVLLLKSLRKRAEEGSYLPSNRNSPKSERIENAPFAILISTEQF